MKKIVTKEAIVINWAISSAFWNFWRCKKSNGVMYSLP